jgi:hypothetical protein
MWAGLLDEGLKAVDAELLEAFWPDAMGHWAPASSHLCGYVE